MAHFWRLRPLRPRANYGAGQTQMSRIALIDTRLKIPEESIGTIVSTHETDPGGIKANERFKADAGKRGKGSRPHENRHSQSTAGRREHVNPGIHLLQEGENQGRAEGYLV